MNDKQKQHKDPAFLFYSMDWLTDTAEMTDSEVRVLIDLMCYNHINKSLPIESERLARQSKRSLEEFTKIWETIKSKFISIGTPNGERLVNRKLSEVVADRKTKGDKNKLIGTFAHVLKKLELSKNDEKTLKKRFNVDELLKIDTEWNTERLTEWCLNGIPFIENENENENKEEDNIKGGVGENTWRTDFEIYKSELNDVYEELINDSEFIIQQEKFHPGVDIKLSLEKAVTNFWGKEAGWKHKKKSRTVNIDWKATLTKAIDMNKVYAPKKTIPNSNPIDFRSDAEHKYTIH